MDQENYLKTIVPGRKGVLRDYMPAIAQLRSEGCTLIQIQNWLKTQGLSVSHVALSKRLKNNPTNKKIVTPKEKDDNKTESQENKPNLNRFKSGQISTRAEREAFASQFIKDNTLPPTVKRRIEKNAKKEQS
ncbi:hypothetical protein [Limnobacter sp. MED105]|uniref:hypothetical protein n=1 Tax=Limnobacter sp. MED105 TaxID=391597 RepID=UPI000590E6C1|nr:hypothetical protein [Limnobacter sp. MED105]